MKRLTATALAVIAIFVVSIVLINGSQAATRTVNVGCSSNLASAINNDSKTTATRFALSGCTYTVTTLMKPQNGDEIVGTGGTTLQAASGLPVIMKPQGQFHMASVRCTGAKFNGSAGTGVCIAGGQMANTSVVESSRIDHNAGVGVSNARGLFKDVEADSNGSLASKGFIAGGLKCNTFCEVSGGSYHDNYGNGVWCDNGCSASSGYPNGFWVHGAKLYSNTGAGVRYEDAPTKALIEGNHIYGNSKLDPRGGVSIRDAQNATIRNNVFDGAGFPHNANNAAIIASDSGRSDRTDLKNIEIYGNTLNGEVIKKCGGVVNCH